MRLKQYLTEKTFNINKDVDYIFNKYFKKLYIAILLDKWDGKFETKTFMSSDLPSKEAQDASKLNPIKIVITTADTGNFYMSLNHYIQLSPNTNVLNILRNYGSIKDATLMVTDRSKIIAFKNELNGVKMKDSIYHELSHWLDDTFHNFFLSKTVKLSLETGKYLQKQGKNNVNASKIEINAQIHTIKQLKRVFSKKWDNLSFMDMLALDGSFSWVWGDLKGREFDIWKKDILKRMAREKLLGKRMTVK
jgi:hypothetical protein